MVARNIVPTPLPAAERLYSPQREQSTFLAERVRAIEEWANSRSQPTVYQRDVFPAYLVPPVTWINTNTNFINYPTFATNTQWGLMQRIKGEPLLSFQTTRPTSYLAWPYVYIAAGATDYTFAGIMLNCSRNGQYLYSLPPTATTLPPPFYPELNSTPFYVAPTISYTGPPNDEPLVIWQNPCYGTLRGNTQYDFDINMASGSAGAQVGRFGVTMLMW